MGRLNPRAFRPSCNSGPLRDSPHSSPAIREIVIFDQSWYIRAGVQVLVYARHSVRTHTR